MDCVAYDEPVCFIELAGFHPRSADEGFVGLQG